MDDGGRDARNGHRYHHGDLREALLGAVAGIVEEEGVEGVSLRAAARRVGVSHAAPAHHFGDKRGLLTAFATRGFHRFTRALETARDPHSPGAAEADLVACGRAYVEFALRESHYFAVMFRPELLDTGDGELQRAGGAAFDVLVRRVGACVAGAPIRDREGTTQRVALTCWSLVHGLAHLLVDGPLAQAGSWTPDAAADAVLGVLRDGLRGQPGWRSG